MILAGKQQEATFQKLVTVTKTVGYRYLLYLPQGYEAEQDRKWPLLLYLHGMGERGYDLDKVMNSGVAEQLRKGLHLPFVIVSPQFPAYEWQWSTDVLGALIDEIVEMYAIDTDRIYVTGVSIGGYGTWALAIAYPDRFAAIAPLMGGGDVIRMSTISHLPIWACHGMKDTIVPFQETEQLVEALKACGSNVQFTSYPQRGHDLGTIYDDAQFYNWFLQYQRKHVLRS